MKSSAFNRLIILFVIISPFFFFIFPTLGGKTLFWGVSSLQFIPWRSFAMVSMFQGQIPFLNPYNGLGSPLLANYQLGFFYPLNWIQVPFFLIGGIQGIASSYNLLVPLHLALAAAGMILFLRSIKCSNSASAIGALAFSMCSYLIARISFFSIIWTLTWLPWMFFTITQVISIVTEGSFSLRKTWWKFLSFIAVFTLLLLAGHAQTAWYAILITAGWSLLYGFHLKKWKGMLVSLGFFLIGGSVAALVSAAQLFPTWEYLQQSHRASSIAYDYAMTYSFWPWRLITFILPNFFGNPGNGSFWGYGNYWEDACYLGLIPFFLAIYAGFNHKRISIEKSPQHLAILYFGLVAILSVTLALGKNTPLFGFLYQNIPSFNMFQAPSRWIILTCFSLAILSAIGFDLFYKAGNWQRKRIILFIVLFTAVIIAGGVTMIILPEIPKTMSISLIRAGVIGFCSMLLLILIPIGSKDGKSLWVVFGMIILTAIDLWTNGYLLNPFTSTAIYKNQGIGKITALTEPRAYVNPGDEYDLKFSRFFRTHDFRPIENWGNLRSVNLPNINILAEIPYVNNFDPLVPASYQALMQQLERANNATLVRWLRHLNAGMIEQMDIESTLGIKYQSVADSRFIHAYRCVGRKPSGGLERLSLNDVGNIDPDHPVFTMTAKNQIIADGCEPDQDWKLVSLSSSFSSINMDFTSENQSWIEIAMIWYPGWNAYLDGSRIEVSKVNGILIGAEVLPGNHQLLFKFEPASSWVGFAISLSTMIILVLFTAVVYTRRSKRDFNE